MRTDHRPAAQQATDAGVGLDVNETLPKGGQLCGLIKMELKQRKNPATGQYEVDPEKPGPFPRLGFRTFGVFDAKAKDIPKDQKFLAMLQAPTRSASGSAPGATAAVPAQAPAATTAPAASMESGSESSVPRYGPAADSVQLPAAGLFLEPRLRRRQAARCLAPRGLLQAGKITLNGLQRWFHD